jgi:hypothetical protein
VLAAMYLLSRMGILYQTARLELSVSVRFSFG